MKKSELRVLVEEVLTEGKVKYLDMPPKFWVVTQASKISELGDILFETDYVGLTLQMKGGLRADEIVAIARSEKGALPTAKALLRKAKQ